MKLKVHPHTLLLRDAFKTTHESRTEQPTLIVELHDPATGLSGIGEAAMTRYYGLDSQRCTAELEAIAPAFAPLPATSPEEIVSRIPADFSPFLRCAIDVAAHDLWAKYQGKRLGLLWEQDRSRKIGTCYTIGQAPLEEMVRKLKAFPWPVYKIKLGGGDDIEVIRRLREHTASPFYVDANTGWTARQTIDFSGPLRDLGVVFIEQPMPPGAAGQGEAHRHSVLPIIADESCQTEKDVERCAKNFSGVNIKIGKCGGLLPARRMIAEARVRGLQVMAGCMTESSVGISAIAQLLPELDYADLDGAMLLSKEPAEGVTFAPETGFAIYPERAGTGARLV